jgi:Flp pilus assembly protein TadG
MAQRGTITIWVLGLCVALLFLGGLGADFWHAIAVRRQLSATADAAATAGANGLDEQQLRAGKIQIDPARARALADEVIAQEAPPDASASIEIDANQVTVTMSARVNFTLLGIFMRGQGFAIRVRASARPEER